MSKPTDIAISIQQEHHMTEPLSLPTLPDTAAQRLAALLADISKREEEVRSKIQGHEQEIKKLRVLKARADEMGDQATNLECFSAMTWHQQEMTIDYRQLSPLEEERQAAIRGGHPKIAASVQADVARARVVAEAEYKSATEAFLPMITPELIAAAKRLAQATRSLGIDSHPSSTVRALLGEI